MNSNQKKLKQDDSGRGIFHYDQEFLRPLPSISILPPRHVLLRRYCYGLQALISWDESDGAALAYTDSYKIYLNAANRVTRAFRLASCGR